VPVAKGLSNVANTGATAAQTTNQNAIASAEEPAVVYPVLTFRGTGSLTSAPDNYNIAQNTTYKMDNTAITVTVVSSHSSKSEVDKKLQASVGPSVFQRTTKARLDQLQSAPGFAAATMLFFADSVRKPGGATATYSSPLPVFVVPAARSRYAPLDKGPLTFNAMVTAGSRFPVRVTIEKVRDSGKYIVVRTTTTIDQDRDGTLYEAVGLPHITEYNIDTDQHHVITLTVHGYYHNDQIPQSQSRQNIDLFYQLCSSQTGAKTETFPCY